MLKNKKIWFFSLAIFIFQAMLLFHLYEKNANSDVSEALTRNNNRFDNSIRAIMQNMSGVSYHLQNKARRYERVKEFSLLSDNTKKETWKLHETIDSVLLVIWEKEAKKAYHLSDTIWQNSELFYTDLQEKLDIYYEKSIAIFKEKSDKNAIEITHFLERMKKSKTKILALTKNISSTEHELVLRKLQADIATTGFMCVHYLNENVPEKFQYLFDKFDAAVVLNKNQVQQGEDLNAAIYLAASSSMAKYTVWVKGKELPLDKNGMATYKEKATKIGTFDVEASITRTNPVGQKSTITGEINYEVVEACD
ncbi:MAG: hypothetical protein ACPG5B_11655 [Chitinophagales bacterium]